MRKNHALANEQASFFLRKSSHAEKYQQNKPGIINMLVAQQITIIAI
ncbi:hypothetical protein ACO0LG_22140 [Undibacterium sp. Ji42W]